MSSPIFKASRAKLMPRQETNQVEGILENWGDRPLKENQKFGSLYEFLNEAPAAEPGIQQKRVQKS